MQSMYILDGDSNSLQIHSATSDVGYYLTPPISGLEFPDIDISTSERAGEHGIHIANNLYRSRRITLEGTCFGSSLSDYASKRQNLEKFLRLERDSYGVAQQKTLKFTTDNSLALQCGVVMASPLKMQIEDISHARFMIDLIGDYILEAQSATTHNYTTPSGGGFTLPVVLPITFTASAGSTSTETNNGNGEAWPTVTFTGPLTNPALRNKTLGRTLGITYSVPSGSTVVVNMRDKTIIENGTTNRINKRTVASKWWWLDPGDSDIIFTTSNSTDTGSCTLSFRDSYVGV